MTQEQITTYKNSEIMRQTITDHETLKLLERVKMWYYKILPPNVWIEMEGWKFHAINGWWHRLTDKWLRYFELIVKERKISYYIKYLFETQNWEELKNMIKSKID